MRFISCVFSLILVVGNALANDINIIGTIDYTFSQTNHLPQMTYQQKTKSIKLLKIELSDALQESISKKINSIPTQNHSNIGWPWYSIQLGMNEVPVLDQGRHGTCATFAVTAAVDAILNKGNYISQLCLLQLGNYLEKIAYFPSGWEGSFGETILNELLFFGIVSKQQQLANGCGGLSEYPTNENSHPLTEMIPLEYHQNSESLVKLVGWSSVVDQFRYDDKITSKDILANIKKTLDSKNRLTFGVILVDLNLGTAGAVGKNHTANDSWVFTTEIKKDILDFINGKNPGLQIGGHEMIITGYDDYSMAIDDHGNKHWGLFTLRNSWGDKAGDNGDFYMSYDYLSTLIIEAHRIRAL